MRDMRRVLAWLRSWRHRWHRKRHWTPTDHQAAVARWQQEIAAQVRALESERDAITRGRSAA